MIVTIDFFLLSHIYLSSFITNSEIFFIQIMSVVNLNPPEWNADLVQKKIYIANIFFKLIEVYFYKKKYLILDKQIVFLSFIITPNFLNYILKKIIYLFWLR